MSITPEGITNPPIDDLLETTDSKYRLVLFAAKRARQINAYYSQLGEGLLENVGPLVSASPEEKPLSIALREIKEGLLQYNEVDPEAEARKPVSPPTRRSPSSTPWPRAAIPFPDAGPPRNLPQPPASRGSGVVLPVGGLSPP